MTATRCSLPPRDPHASVRRGAFLRAPVILGGLILVLPLLHPARLEAQIPDSTGLVVQNVLITGGALGSDPLVTSILNSLLADQLSSGDLRSLLEIRDLQDATAQNDPSIAVALYTGIDQDGNPADDFVGAEPFDIEPNGLFPDGSPVALIPNGSIAGGELLAGPTSLDLGFGAPISMVTLAGSLNPGAGAFTSDPLDGAVPESVLQMTPAPPPFIGSLANALASFGIFPDVDLSGNGTPDAYSVTFILAAVSCVIEHPFIVPVFVRGDANADGGVNLADAITMLNELFSGGPASPCQEAVDVNDDGSKNIADPIGLLDFLFASGPLPPAPFPLCGEDFDGDAIPCTLAQPCP